MRDAALHLAFDQQRIDLMTAIVHRDIFLEPDFARVTVQLDCHDVRAERIGAVRRFEKGGGFEAGLPVLRNILRNVGLGRESGPVERFFRVAADKEFAVAKFDILLL